MAIALADLGQRLGYRIAVVALAEDGSAAVPLLGAAICLVIFACIYALLEFVGHFSGRALYIHTGVIFGTTALAAPTRSFALLAMLDLIAGPLRGSGERERVDTIA